MKRLIPLILIFVLSFSACGVLSPKKSKKNSSPTTSSSDSSAGSQVTSAVLDKLVKKIETGKISDNLLSGENPAGEAINNLVNGGEIVWKSKTTKGTNNTSDDGSIDGDGTTSIGDTGTNSDTGSDLVDEDTEVIEEKETLYESDLPFDVVVSEKKKATTKNVTISLYDLEVGANVQGFDLFINTPQGISVTSIKLGNELIDLGWLLIENVESNPAIGTAFGITPVSHDMVVYIIDLTGTSTEPVEVMVSVVEGGVKYEKTLTTYIQ